MHEARARAGGRGRRGRVEAVVRSLDVDEDGAAAGLGRPPRAVATNVIAGTITSSPGSSPGREEREPERVEPARDPDAIGRPAIQRERLLERGHLGPVREGPGVDEPRQLGENRLLQPCMRRREVQKRDVAAHESDAHRPTSGP